MTALGDIPVLGWVKRSLDGVTAMWSEKVDARGIAVCRVLLFYHAAKEIDPEQYSRFMLVGEQAWRPHGYMRMLDLMPPSPVTASYLCVAYALSGALAAAGLFYRGSALVCALLSLYLHGILQNFGKSLHTYHLFTIALLIMACARAADVWSVDALIQRGLASRRGKAYVPPEPSAEYRWPLMFVGSIILVMYGAAGMSKLYLTGWVWALSDTFRQTLLQGQFDAAPPTKIGVWLANYPLLCKVASLAALSIEAASWLGLANRYLFWIWGAFVALLQFGIWVLMGVVFGELPTMFACFLPWNFLIEKLDVVVARYRPLKTGSK